VCCALVTAPAGAQESIASASVSGRVLDQQGGVLPGASVVARQTETNVIATATTDQEGRFRFPFLKVGPYEIKAQLQGFADVTRKLTVGVGSAFELSIVLPLGAIDTTVTVAAEPAALETARTQIAATVRQVEVQALPMNGRNFLDLALLVPGVSPTNTASTQLFAETSAIPGQGISVGSQRNLSNNFIVDGLSANDDAAGFAGMPYGVDAVDQFQVVTSGGQAELGRALGGYVSVVTKSGTNMFRGDLYGYFRDDALNARNALSGRTLPMNQKQYGVSAGGPVRRDRTFYFSNLEQRTLNQTGFIAIAPDVVPTINARLAETGYRGSPIATGLYPNPVDSTNLLGKVDHQASDADQIGVRYALYHVSADNSRGAGALNAASASAGLDNIDQSVAMSNTLVISARTVNETRAQFAYASLKALPTDPIGPAVSIAGVASFGTLSGSPTGRTNKMYQVVDNLAHQTGRHALKAGIDLLLNDDEITFPRSNRGAYTFSSLANFLTGAYNNAGFTQTFGATAVSQRNPNVGVYAQDEWKVTPGVTLNAGLRYDLQFLQTITTDTNNLSPRVGVAWTPSGSNRTIVRGSGGIFYDRVPLRAVANALLSAGNTTELSQLRQINVSLSPAQAGALVFPGILAAPVPLVTLVNFTTIDRHIQNAHSTQASAEVERQLGDRATVSVGYQYVRGMDLIISVNQNVPGCVASGTNNGCRPNPSYANNSQYSSAALSNYHGMHVSFVQRPARWGNYRVSYTLSKSMNDVGENFFSSPIDPFDISKDWGRSDDDQRHRLVVSGAMQSHGFQLSGMLQSYSALPFNITSGLTTIQGTAGRPIVNGAFIPRNAGVGSDFFSLNLRLSRRFRIDERRAVEGLVEAFNVTNRTNNVTRNTNFGAGTYPTAPSPGFGQVTAVSDPRTLQLGVRLTF
jgi:hypothetical protein